MIQTQLKSLQQRLLHLLRVHPIVADIALLLVLLIWVVAFLPTIPGSESGFNDIDVWGYLLIFIQLIALVFLRRNPLIAYIVLQSAFLGYNALGYGSIQTLFFASLVGAYMVALYTKGRQSIASLLLNLAGLIIFFYTTYEPFIADEILNASVLWMAAWFLGLIHRLYKESKQAEAELAQRAAAEAIIEERNRLARELHDSVTQSLHGSALMAEAAKRLAISGDLERTIEYLSRLSEISQQALKEMRLLVYELRPFALTQVTLREALQQRLDAVEQRAGVDVQLNIADDFMELPDAVEETLYRITQEALNNALQHAHATSVIVNVYLTGATSAQQVILEISDDGVGFAVKEQNNQGGIGLSSMRERAEKFEGNFVIHSSPGAGTQVKTVINF